MSNKPKKAGQGLAVSSDELKNELIEIKERVGALETIATIANRQPVEEFVRTHLTTSKAKEIMRECEVPRTREYLVKRFKFASAQALDHHLNLLRGDNLLHQHTDDAGLQVFVWSNLFKRLLKSARESILED
jgi:hypothetical protein